MPWALVAAGVTFFSTLGGGFAALRWRGGTAILMSVAGGVVLAAAFFDLLPDAVNRAAELHLSASVPLTAVVAGFLLFQFIERVTERGHEGDSPDPAGLIGALGFVIHSFFDGLAIGLGFRVSAGLGILVAAAVIGHDFSDGLNTVSYLLAHRQPLRRSQRWLVADATTPVIGALVASIAPVPDTVFPLALGFFSGLFIYAAAGQLLPRSRTLPAGQAIPLVLTGTLFMFLVTRLA